MKGSFVLACIALAAFGPSAAQAYVIDDFSTGPSYVSITSGSQSANTAAASALGGFRYTDIAVGANLYGLNASVSTLGGAYTLNTDAGVYGYSYLGYGYGSTGTPQNLNFDLLAQGDTLQFNFAQIDPVLNFNVVLFTSTTYGSYGINIGPQTTPYTLNIPISAFGSVGTPDYHHVEEIYVEFNQSSGVVYGADIALTSVKVVPEPATCFSLAMGAAVLLRRKRAHRKNWNTPEQR